MRYVLRRSEILFVFPHFHIGGAEKVHLDIVSSSQTKKCVIFTSKSTTETYLEAFKTCAVCFDLSELLTANLNLKSIVTKITINSINTSPRLKVLFGSNSNYFYDLLDFANPKLNVIDLTHAFSCPVSGIENYSLKSVPRIDKRIVVCNKTRLDYEKLYLKNGLYEYLSKINIIKNGVDLPFPKLKRMNKGLSKIQLLFVGRNSPEKRFDLVLEILELLQKYKIAFTLNVIGPGFDNSSNVNPNIFYLGPIHDKKQINSYYESADILLLTSEREGFPLVVMEAMSYGVIPITTNVGGLNEEIENGENGFLIDFDEKKIGVCFAEIIKYINDNIYQNERISCNSFNYAKNNFSKDNMLMTYQKILDQ